MEKNRDTILQFLNDKNVWKNVDTYYLNTGNRTPSGTTKNAKGTIEQVNNIKIAYETFFPEVPFRIVKLTYTVVESK